MALRSNVVEKPNLQAYIALDPTNRELRRDAAREALDAGDWPRASGLIEEGLAMFPADPVLLAFSGLVHLEARRYVQAETALSMALTGELDAPGPRYNLAFALFAQGRHEESLAHLADPRLAAAVPLALLLRARCLHHLQRHEEAIAACAEYLRIAPEAADAHGILALLLQESGRGAEAEPHIAAALARDPRQLEAMLASASIRQDARDFSAARASYGTLVEAYPGCGRGWLGLGLVELAEERIDVAKKRIERATECLPRHIGSWHVLAWICLMQGDTDGAERAFVKSMAVNRTFGESHGGLAAVAALRGHNEEARQGIRRAMRLDPRCMSARFAELILLQRAGKGSEARALFEDFLRQPVPGRDVLYRDLAIAHMRHMQSRQATGEATPTVH